jgi:hypothetical protein
MATTSYFTTSTHPNSMHTAMASRSDEHPLQEAWTYYYSHRSQKEKVTDYESAIKVLTSFSTVGIQFAFI